jgi:hypothetical protein
VGLQTADDLAGADVATTSADGLGADKTHRSRIGGGTNDVLQKKSSVGAQVISARDETVSEADGIPRGTPPGIQQAPIRLIDFRQENFQCHSSSTPTFPR